MPVTKSAIRKLRVDKKRTLVNLRLKKRYKLAFKIHFKEKTAETLKRLYSLLDRAVKRNIFHKNKAARLKSRAAKVIEPAKAKPKPTKTKTKLATKKKAVAKTKKKVATKKKAPARKKKQILK